MRIPFPTSSDPQPHGQEEGGRLINGYAEKTGQGARSPIIWRRSAGLTYQVEAAYSGFRGGIETPNGLIAALANRAVIISGGLVTDLGQLDGDERITVAKNNASPPDIVAVTSNGAKNLFIGSAPTDFADADLPVPNSVCFLRGYFLFTIGDGRIFASDVNSVSVNSLSFARAEGRSDGLSRGVALNEDFFAFGEASCEVFTSAGTSPFPLRLVTTIPRGLAGRHAVAGWEEGWANQLIWAADDNRVYRMDGYTPTPISTSAVERSIAGSDKTALEAGVYMANGNAFWWLSSPGNWTWEFNATTGLWNERKSHGRDDWQISQTVYFNRAWWAGQRDGAIFYTVDPLAHNEGGEPLVWEIESGVPQDFPGRVAVPRAEFDFSGGVGNVAGADPMETAPRVSVSWSNDGGYSWGNALEREIGGPGNSDQRVVLTRTGMTGPKGRRWKLSMSDPVHLGFMGGEMFTSERLF